jgi:ribonuclease E
MTRKRIGTGLLESFSHDCPQCHGRGVVIEDAPVEPRKAEEEPKRARRGRSRGKAADEPAAEPLKPPSPKDIAAMARHHEEHPDDESEDQLDEQLDEQLDDQLDMEPDLEQLDVEPDLDQAPEPVVEVAAEPEKPRVVTRTRRRAATRPAGPPAASSAPDRVDGSGVGEVVADAADEHADGTPALHVPVKRKGRKR